VCIFDDEKTSFVSGHYTSSAFANLQLHEAISKDVYGAGNIMVRGIAWPAQRETCQQLTHPGGVAVWLALRARSRPPTLDPTFSVRLLRRA